MKRNEALDILRAEQEHLRRDFGVKSLALFGSVARDQAKDSSDVDLLVEFDRPIGLLHLIGTQQYIEKRLGVARVDLILRRAIIPELKEDILTEAVDAF
jgi:predicted nucleotidyltransferase